MSLRVRGGVSALKSGAATAAEAQAKADMYWQKRRQTRMAGFFGHEKAAGSCRPGHSLLLCNNVTVRRG